jgi:5-carboxymethyl-2-hydroxymuconate isomerase
MPHLRLEVPEEWLREDFKQSTGFDVKKLLDHLVETVAAMRMGEPQVPLINKINLKHAIIPAHYAHVAGDPNKRFIHVTLAAGNDTPGRTAEVRSGAAVKLGNEIDAFLANFPAVAAVVASATVWVQDIDRDRGYTTTAERKKAREIR